MGELLLCSHGIASMPYYIETIALNVYSLEEMCYYLKNNIDLADPSFMDDELIEWVRTQLKLPALAGRLEKRKAQGSLYEFVAALVTGCDYCTGEELERMKEALADFENKSEAECAKIRADRLLSKRRYRACIFEYRKLLERPEASGEFAGNIYHNLGCAYAGLFLFEQAADCYGKAYRRNKNPLSMQQMQEARKLAEGIKAQDLTEEEEKNPLSPELLRQWKESYIRSCR